MWDPAGISKTVFRRLPNCVAQIDALHLEGSRWLITRMVVPEKFQNRGIGTELMQELLCWADEKSYILEAQITFPPEANINKEKVAQFLQRFGFCSANFPDLYTRLPKKALS